MYRMNKALRGLKNIRDAARADMDKRRAEKDSMESFAKKLDAESRCRYCGETVPGDPERCPHCNCVCRKPKAAAKASAPVKAPTCKFCGEGVQASAERCPKCGGRLAPR